MLKSLNTQYHSFGIITKLMLLRANGRWSYEYNMHLLRCSSSRAFAHILGGAALAQKRPNVGACVPVRKDGNNQHADLKLLRKFSTKKWWPRNNCRKANGFAFNKIFRKKNSDRRSEN